MKREEIARYLDAKVQLFFVRTHEEVRFEEMMRKLSSEKKMGFYSWSLWAKLIGNRPNIDNTDIYAAMNEVITNLPNSSIILLKDCNKLLKEPGILRRIKEFVVNLSYYYQGDELKYKPIFLVDADLEIPCELEKYGVLIDYELMDKSEILELFEKHSLTLSKDVADKVANNLKGLTHPAQKVCAFNESIKRYNETINILTECSKSDKIYLQLANILYQRGNVFYKTENTFPL